VERAALVKSLAALVGLLLQAALLNSRKVRLSYFARRSISPGWVRRGAKAGSAVQAVPQVPRVVVRGARVV
jgi:hypothetical protein